MQIEVVDDASAADPTPLVRGLCGDRVVLFRHERNRGHVGTFNTCLARARGAYVHLLHADDAVRDGFYERLGAALDGHPEVGAAFCRYLAWNDDGNWIGIGTLEQPRAGILAGWQETLALGQRLQAPSMVVRRSVYESLGGFDDRFASYGEDWDMWMRIAAAYPVWYEPEPLALYRVGDDSLSSGALRTGENVRQLLQAIELNRGRLPPERAAQLTAAARRTTASAAIRRAIRLARGGDLAAGLTQLRWSIRADRSVRTALYALAALAVISRERIRQANESA